MLRTQQAQASGTDTRATPVSQDADVRKAHEKTWTSAGDSTLEAALSFVQAHGPFDGVLGFSQVCARSQAEPCGRVAA